MHYRAATPDVSELRRNQVQGRAKPRKAGFENLTGNIEWRAGFENLLHTVTLTFQFVVIPYGKRDLSSLPEAAVQIS